MIGSQTGDIRVYRLGEDITELGLQYYVDRSSDGSHMAAYECNGFPGEAELWIGTPLSTGKTGQAIAFQRGGRRPCQVAGAPGGLPVMLKLGAGGKLVPTALSGDLRVAFLPEPLTGDGLLTVDLETHAIKMEDPPPSLGG